MDILNKQLCLQLNKSWIACGVRTVRQAIVMLCSEHNGETPALALDIEMTTDESTGEQTLLYVNPVDWQTWITLPIREGDLYINSSSGPVRAPLVLICKHYNSVPLHRPRLSLGNIYERDQGTCQYSGQKLPRNSLNIDHVVPRSRGGRDEWSNMVLADKRINSMKGDRLNSEVGLKLLRAPKAPPSVPVSSLIKEAKHPSWAPFLFQNKS